jgi:hypothetical protein
MVPRPTLSALKRPAHCRTAANRRAEPAGAPRLPPPAPRPRRPASASRATRTAYRLTVRIQPAHAVRVLRARVDRGLPGPGHVAGAAAGPGGRAGRRVRADRGRVFRRRAAPAPEGGEEKPPVARYSASLRPGNVPACHKIAGYGVLLCPRSESQLTYMMQAVLTAELVLGGGVQ